MDFRGVLTVHIQTILTLDGARSGLLLFPVLITPQYHSVALSMESLSEVSIDSLSRDGTDKPMEPYHL